MATTIRTPLSRDQYLRERFEMMKVKKAADTPPAPPIPEAPMPKDTRLYKAKFIEASERIKLLEADVAAWRGEYTNTQSAYEKAVAKNKELSTMNDKLKREQVNSEAVLSRVKALIKELRLPISVSDYRTADAALNAFFGLIYTRIRVTEEEDVLSE